MRRRQTSIPTYRMDDGEARFCANLLRAIDREQLHRPELAKDDRWQSFRRRVLNNFYNSFVEVE